MDIGREGLFHPDRRAAAPDIAGRRQQLLHVQHLDALVARCAGRRFQIDLRVARHDADQNVRPVAAQHERLEHALDRLAELLGHMDGCQIVLEGEGFESGGDTPYIEGPLGKVYKGFRCTIPDIMEKLAEMPDPAPQNTDFLECVRTRSRFALDEQIGHRSSTLVNLGACALRLNRTLHFDPDKQLFIGDDAANRLIDQPMRGPWHI